MGVYVILYKVDSHEMENSYKELPLETNYGFERVFVCCVCEPIWVTSKGEYYLQAHSVRYGQVRNSMKHIHPVVSGYKTT